MTQARLRDAFAHQAQACTALGSAFMGQLCTLFATRDWPDTPLRDRMFRWPGDIGPSGHSLPLRLAGGLHALQLLGDPIITAAYPPSHVDDDTLWAAVQHGFAQHGGFLDDWIDSPPQTNEVRRAAVLIAVGHWLTAQCGLPIRLSELGASAGLNLMWDHFALRIGDATFGPDTPALTLEPDWQGPLPPAHRPHVSARSGVDLSPVNDAPRLRAYLWPDQPDRLTRTDAAIAIARATVDRGDAIDWLGTHLDHKPGELHLIYHTIAWQYFPAHAQARGAQMIAAAGARATAQTPLAWFGMEADGKGDGAALTLRLWPGDMHIPLGRADFHGRWVIWDAP